MAFLLVLGSFQNFLLIFIISLFWPTTTTTSALLLQPAAAPPTTNYKSASDIPNPPPVIDPFDPSPLDKVFLTAFRWTLQQQSSKSKGREGGGEGSHAGVVLRSDRSGFDGMVDELLTFRQVYGLDEQERVSYQTLIALSGPIPFIYKHLFSQAEYSPAILAWFAKYLLPFLVGEMELTERSLTDKRSGGVVVKRCQVLEGTNCKGVCTKMCKIPTQRFFKEKWGVPLSMTPNFETGQCQLAFGNEPLPVEEDPTIPTGCLTRCPAASAMMEKQQHQYRLQEEQHRSSDTC